MPKLIREQPRTLYEVVKFAKKKGGILPTAKELAKLLGIEERNASARLKRIIEAFPDDFIIRGRTRRINYDHLVTEKETAGFFLSIHESLDNDGSILKDDVIKSAGFEDEKQGRLFLETAIEGGYLEKIILKENKLRLTEKFYGQLDYLKYLATL